MAFYTSLKYYRPTPPPPVTVAQLIGFLERFAALNVAEAGLFAVQVKFGRAIDQDDRPTSWEEPLLLVPPPRSLWERLVRLVKGDPPAEPSFLAKIVEIEWDCDEQCDGIPSVIAALRRCANENPIYRAHLMLGGVSPVIAACVQRLNSPENDQDLGFDSWGLALGPVESCALGGDSSYEVGWIDVSISGYGYLFPWTFRDLVQHADACPDLLRVTQLCREYWPIKERIPDARRLEGRRSMGDLWPYAVDAPVDWAWGLHESG